MTAAGVEDAIGAVAIVVKGTVVGSGTEISSRETGSACVEDVRGAMATGGRGRGIDGVSRTGMTGAVTRGGVVVATVSVVVGVVTREANVTVVRVVAGARATCPSASDGVGEGSG